MTKYENWRELAIECRESGLSVSGWCKKNSIPGTTCRQWLTRLRKEEETKQTAGHNADLQQWERIDLEMPKMPTSFDHSSFSAVITLSYQGWEIEVKAGFDPILLSQIIKVVDTVC